ncbi:MAG: nucleotidyltransferase family protein [Hyphomicrobiales bacterium]|nr:nucleotidyltransferase family protein [Hyphomicrobiales bacterium]
MSIGAVILAAGRSTRMGTNKLIAELGGKPLIRRTVEAVLASRAHPVIIVTGHETQKLVEALAGLEVLRVGNPRYAEGLSTSLNIGLASLTDEARAALICLGDMPLIEPATLDKLIESFEKEPERDAVVPAHGGEWGNPVLLSRKLFPLVATLRGDMGARKLLQERNDVRVLEVGDPAILRDADTPEAFQDLQGRVGKI